MVTKLKHNTQQKSMYLVCEGSMRSTFWDTFSETYIQWQYIPWNYMPFFVKSHKHMHIFLLQFGSSPHLSPRVIVHTKNFFSIRTLANEFFYRYLYFY